MTTQSLQPIRTQCRLDAEVAEIVRALRGYQVLTRCGLAEACHARHWREPAFDRALERALESGVVRRLGDDLYELVDEDS